MRTVKNVCLWRKKCDTLSKVGAFEIKIGALEPKFSGNDFIYVEDVSTLYYYLKLGLPPGDSHVEYVKK